MSLLLKQLSEAEAFFADINEDLKKQRKEKKSDDIIDWIEWHWKFFCSSRRQMVDYIGQLGKELPYSVDSLCDLLGIPNNVYFKRSPVIDIGGTLLNFPTSKLLELFNRCLSSGAEKEACLIVVAGKKSICITNMQTTINPGYFISYYRDPLTDTETHVFSAEDIPNRLPNLFYKEEL